MIRLLLSIGANPSVKNQNGSNALHIAVKLGHLGAAKEIASLKNYPVDEEKENGVTAYGIAAYRGHINML